MASFDYPWQYNFPPFFTIQVNEDTKKQQLKAWKQFVLDYTKDNKQCIIDVREAQRSSLFYNNNISRQLPSEGITLVMEELQRTGHADPIDKAKSKWHIYWKTLDELGAAVYRWATANGMVGTVCTLYEIMEGDMTTNEIFHRVDKDILIKALKKLELSKKAEIISFDDNQGVKFF